MYYHILEFTNSYFFLIEKKNLIYINGIYHLRLSISFELALVESYSFLVIYISTHKNYLVISSSNYIPNIIGVKNN